MRRSKCRSLGDDDDPARDRALSRLRMQRRKLCQRDAPSNLQRECPSINQRHELGKLLRITPNEHEHRR